MSVLELKFYDISGDLVVLAEEVPNYPSDRGDNLVLCLASDHNYIESSDGYFRYLFMARQHIRSVAREELPLYINKKYKAKKFVELFK